MPSQGDIHFLKSPVLRSVGNLLVEHEGTLLRTDQTRIVDQTYHLLPYLVRPSSIIANTLSSDKLILPLIGFLGKVCFRF